MCSSNGAELREHFVPVDELTVLRLLEAHRDGLVQLLALMFAQVVHVVVGIRQDKLDLFAFGQVGGLVQDEAVRSSRGL